MGQAAPVVATYHCAGFVPLAADANLLTLHKAATLPSAPAVCQLVVSRFAQVAAQNLSLGTNLATAALLEPMVSDVLTAESLGSFGEATAKPLSFVLALRLDAARAQVWQQNLAKAFAGPGEKLQVEEFTGWEWKSGGADGLWLLPARDWLLVGRGDDLAPVRSEYLTQLKLQGRPGASLQSHWLEADVDLTRWAALLPGSLRLFKPARVQLTVATEADHLHTTAHVTYPEPIAWQSSPWQLPVSLVPNRFNSFTAGQNIAAFLNLDPRFSQLTDSPLTNQFCLWALGGMPFLDFAAWPAVNTNVLERFSRETVAAFDSDLKRFNGTQLVWETNLHRLALGNLRVTIPTVEAVEDKTGTFLVMSIFQRMPVPQPATDDLWKQIKGRTDLVYYDWEITGSRLQDWRLLGRMLLFPQPRPMSDGMIEAGNKEDKWLTDLIPFWSGNTVTEVTRVSPNELSVARNSPMGLTGIEIFELCDWLGVLGIGQP